MLKGEENIKRDSSIGTCTTMMDDKNPLHSALTWQQQSNHVHFQDLFRMLLPGRQTAPNPSGKHENMLWRLVERTFTKKQ